MLIGVVVNDVELKEVAEGKKVVRLRLAVRREFQNMNGEYDTDFINVTLWEFLAEHAITYIKKGAKVAIKGRICPRKDQSGENPVYTNELYADRLVFLGEQQTKEISNKESSAKE
jgi:single-strand DNA-binding protein